MYTVYIDDKVAYSPMLSNEGYSIMAGKVIKELNKAGSFEFTLPPGNVMYDNIHKLKSIVRVVSSDSPSYILKDTERTYKSTQSSIKTRILYKDAKINERDGKISLENPLDVSGSDTYKIYTNYEKYPFFYGDLTDGKQDSNVYKFTNVSRSISTGTITIAFYSYTYYLQESSKEEARENEIFFGRVLNDKKGFYRKKEVYCEGQLAFLLDSVQRPYQFQGDIPELFTQFLNSHNSQVDDWKQFQIGNVTVTDSNNYINRESTQYPNTFDELNEKLINTHGGYVVPRLQDKVRYIDYLSEPGKKNSQVIEFGKNLLDITEYITAENIFTVLIPLGAKQTDENGNEAGRLTIESVNDGKDYIESELGISLFGRITKKKEWDDITIPDNLLKAGKEYLESGIELAVSIEIKAYDLHNADIKAEEISEGDDVRVISPPHNIDSFFRCIKIELDLLEPGNSIYTFGFSFTTLTERIKKI